ncbi:MAG: hypothetical protein KDA42_02535 [Planctomycetales bacterium]|nr:hypothetical protein [Planctomycetales bacterium]
MTLATIGSVLAENPLLVCFLIIACGMGIGAIRVFGVSLGASGVLFSALLFGHWGHTQDWTFPESLGTFGLVLFVYAIGLGAGQTFFRAFRAQGSQLAILSALTVVSAAIISVGMGIVCQLPTEFVSGLFAGALTSTPGLASAMESVEAGGLDASLVSIGYGLAYPIGVVLTVLYVQLLPRIQRLSLDDSPAEKAKNPQRANQIYRRLVEIANPSVFGRRIDQLDALDSSRAQVTRVLEDHRLVPIRSDHVFEAGQVVMLVCASSQVELITLALGKASEATYTMDSERDRAEVVVTNPQMLHRSLRELQLRSRYGVTISRIERYGLSFVPNADATLSMADRLIVVGPPDSLKAFESAAGHRPRRLHETDLMSLGVGLAVGVGLGNIPIPVGAGSTIHLGLAGGPLLSGLLFAHFGRFLGVVGYMPRAARLVAQELGLALFLAAAGFRAGGQLVDVTHQLGIMPIAASALVASAAIAVAHFSSRKLLGMNPLETIGGVCGAMTSTAGIGAILNKTDSDTPVTSYAAAYPVALVLMTIFARLVFAFLSTPN